MRQGFDVDRRNCPNFRFRRKSEIHSAFTPDCITFFSDPVCRGGNLVGIARIIGPFESAQLEAPRTRCPCQAIGGGQNRFPGDPLLGAMMSLEAPAC